ncbi:MAG: hypothetical protein HDR51_04235 [Treponema sp.]|nr:hypothetical protein [Treponema sp.]MBD5410872.1 hypothetical protein [Treponema sp.]MBD5411939.1 hypothetical protein [Treponema sp.]
MEIIQHIDEKVIVIKTHESTVQSRGTLYEAIRKWWDLNKERASRAEYVFAVVREHDEIVQEVYKPNDWYKEQDGEQSKTDIDLCFNGSVAEESIRSKYIGKYIPKKYRYQKGQVASCFYTYE